MTSPTAETIPPEPGADSTTPEMKELQVNADELAASLPSTLTATLELACNDAESAAASNCCETPATLATHARRH